VQADNLRYYKESDTRISYVRYADDFLVGVKGDKKTARDIFQLILYFCESELKLELHPEKTGIKHKSKGVIYLGYKI